MAPLTVQDLLPIDDYASRRKEYFDSHRRYVERFRRVHIGPSLTLIFENRQTLWFRVHETIRLARLAKVEEWQQELNLYNRLLPGNDRLQAVLLIDIADPENPARDMDRWRSLSDEHLSLCVGEHRFASHLVTDRPGVGTSHWVRFVVPQTERECLANLELPAFFRFDDGRFQYVSDRLGEDFRLSLLDDLELSDAKRSA